MIRDRRSGLRSKALASVTIAGVLGLLAWPASAASAAAATTTTTTSGAAPRESPTQLETLVSRVALYPDDLVAVIIPAATYPLQVVEAARWLEKRKKDSKLAIPETWDDSVKTLANYPEVIRMMNDDLQWTQAMNDAIVTDQGGRAQRRAVVSAQGDGRGQPQVR